MITSEEIKSRLWDGATELRGSMDASRYKDYMLGLMFYKFLSDKTLETFRNNAGLGRISESELVEAYTQNREELGEELDKMIQKNEDPLKEAMRFARIGNYIDFSALECVSEEEFLKLFGNEKDRIDEEEYGYLRQDLQHASRLVYIMDNCGEIVLDKLVIRELKKLYPSLHITAMVRGREAVNDATVEDAQMAGITKEVPVITNNSSITGVVLSELPGETREVLDKADLILAKGQGNFESLHGCGKNIYYLFLCKCELFSQRFQVEQFQGMLVNEKRVQIQERRTEWNFGHASTSTMEK